MQARPSPLASAGCFISTPPKAAAMLLWHAIPGAVLAFDALLLINLPFPQNPTAWIANAY
jgi:hypothetical protein